MHAEAIEPNEKERYQALLSREWRLRASLFHNYEVVTQGYKQVDVKERESVLGFDELTTALIRRRGVGRRSVEGLLRGEESERRLKKVLSADVLHSGIPEDVQRAFYDSSLSWEQRLLNAEEIVRQQYPKAYASYQSWDNLIASPSYEDNKVDKTEFRGEDVRTAIGRVLGPKDPKINVILDELRVLHDHRHRGA